MSSTKHTTLRNTACTGGNCSILNYFCIHASGSAAGYLFIPPTYKLSYTRRVTVIAQLILSIKNYSNANIQVWCSV